MYKEGHYDGRQAGYDIGYPEGRAKGYGEGYDTGFPDGIMACPREHK